MKRYVIVERMPLLRVDLPDALKRMRAFVGEVDVYMPRKSRLDPGTRSLLKWEESPFRVEVISAIGLDYPIVNGLIHVITGIQSVLDRLSKQEGQEEDLLRPQNIKLVAQTAILGYTILQAVDWALQQGLAGESFKEAFQQKTFELVVQKHLRKLADEIAMGEQEAVEQRELSELASELGIKIVFLE